MSRLALILLPLLLLLGCKKEENCECSFQPDIERMLVFPVGTRFTYVSNVGDSVLLMQGGGPDRSNYTDISNCGYETLNCGYQSSDSLKLGNLYFDMNCTGKCSGESNITNYRIFFRCEHQVVQSSDFWIYCNKVGDSGYGNLQRIRPNVSISGDDIVQLDLQLHSDGPWLRFKQDSCLTTYTHGADTFRLVHIQHP